MLILSLGIKNKNSKSNSNKKRPHSNFLGGFEYRYTGITLSILLKRWENKGGNRWWGTREWELEK